jgi:uncharacterized Fe-S cluster protein YjdI
VILSFARLAQLTEARSLGSQARLMSIFNQAEGAHRGNAIERVNEKSSKIEQRGSSKVRRANAKRKHQQGGTTMALQVSWDKDVCIHSGNCVKTLPEVFKVEAGKFVIDPGAADDSRVRTAVAACPSKALKIKE